MLGIKQFFSREDLFARHTGIELLDMGPGAGESPDED